MMVSSVVVFENYAASYTAFLAVVKLAVPFTSVRDMYRSTDYKIGAPVVPASCMRGDNATVATLATLLHRAWHLSALCVACVTSCNRCNIWAYVNLLCGDDARNSQYFQHGRNA